MIQKAGNRLNPTRIGSMLSGPLLDLCIKNDVIFIHIERVFSKVLSLLIFQSPGWAGGWVGGCGGVVQGV